MASRRIIVYLGAPSVDDVLKTWKNEVVMDTDTADLPEFTIDPSQRTTEVVWRHLASIGDDPVESLSQELAETSVDSTGEGLYLERSLQIFANRYDEVEGEDQDDEMDGCDPSEWPEASISTPQLAGYDFDVNEITELEDLPKADAILATFHRQYSIIVAVVEISPCQLVMTKFGGSINLVKLVVADQTCPNFEIACWDRMASFAQTLRVDDIIQFRDVGLTEFKGTVSAGTRRKSRAAVLYRCRRLQKEDDTLRPRLDLMDQQTRFVRRLRDWIVRKGAIAVPDIPPTLETQQS